MKQFEELYTLDKKGDLRVFKIEIAEDETADEEQYIIVSATGKLGGNLTENNTVVRKGKQGRSVYGQAEMQATSEWSTKRDEGYKSMNDLLLKAASEDLDISSDQTVEQVFKILDITYNTSANWKVLPMLAEKYGPNKKKVKYPALVQPKLNGVRATIEYDKDLQEVFIGSRGGQSYNVPHLKDLLRPLFLVNQKLVLDGELYVHGKSLQEVSGAVRRKDNVPDWIEYHIYDIVDPKNPQYSRINKLRNIIELSYPGNPYIHFVETYEVNSEAEIKSYHDTFVEAGYEGAMVRDYNGKYEIGFRSNSLLKVKEFLDEEFEIIGGEVSEGKSIGESFVFVLKNNLDDQTFKARPTGTELEKMEFYTNIESYVGKKATLRFQERTQGGLPHQGHVRKDSLIVRDYE